MDSGDVENPAGVYLSVIPPSLLTEEERREILDAFRALSPVEMRRLKGYASVKMISVRERVFYADGGDLLQEALGKTLEGTRKWNRKVSFFYHLIGSMSSIAQNWCQKGSHETPLADEEPADPKPSLSLDWSIDAQAYINQIRQMLEDKPVAREVLEAWMEGHTPAETQALLNISKEVYWAARKQIRRDAMALCRPEGGFPYGW
jgi:DNA-directed RNA polymerase specialized sigma24 family protein